MNPRESRRKQGARYLPVSGADSDDLEDSISPDAYKHLPRRVSKIRRCIVHTAVFLAIGVFALGLSMWLFNVPIWRHREPARTSDDPEDIFKHWGQPGSGTEGLDFYPTDFLRDVDPIPCHSHNDYWRKVPLFSALNVGCMGVEADVWLHDEELYVGHEPAALQHNRTFQSLYIDPLVKILQHQNPATEFYNESRRGVFDTNPDQTLFLLVDVKTGGETTWPWVVKQIEPLRERGWLTRFENGKVIRGPVTVIGTGDTPFHLVVENKTYRDAFFDAPLDKLKDSSYDATNSFYASVSLRETIGHGGVPKEKDLKVLRAQLKEAHSRNLLARYWELPPWPVHLRYHVWDLLTTEGVDILNVDDLAGAASKDWTSRDQDD